MFGSLVITYLFAGGAGAGAFALAALGGLLVSRENVTARYKTPNGRSTCVVFLAPAYYRRLFAPAFGVALVALAVGVIALTADLGVANRVSLLFEFPQPTFMTLGAYTLVGALVLCMLLGAAWAFPQLHWRYRIVWAAEVLALIVGFVVMAYTGLLLSSIQAVPLWATPWLPALFVASSLSCGCALALGTATLTGSFDIFSTTMEHMMMLDAITIVLEMIAAAAFVCAAFGNRYAVAAQDAQNLITGAYATVFVGGFGVCGIAAPLILESLSLARHKRTATFAVALMALVLVGGFALRWSIVSAGVHPQVWV